MKALRVQHNIKWRWIYFYWVFDAVSAQPLFDPTKKMQFDMSALRNNIIESLANDSMERKKKLRGIFFFADNDAPYIFWCSLLCTCVLVDLIHGQGLF